MFFVIIDICFVFFLTAMAHTIVVENTYQCREICNKNHLGKKALRNCKQNFDWDTADPIDCGDESVREFTFKSSKYMDGSIDPEDRTGAELAEIRGYWYLWTSIVIILIPQLMMQKWIKLMTCECLTVDESSLDPKREAQNLLFCCFKRSTGRSLLRWMGEQNLKLTVGLGFFLMIVGLIIFLGTIKERTGESVTAGYVIFQLVFGYISQPINDFFTVYNPSRWLLDLVLFCDMAKTLPIQEAEDLIECEVEIYDPLSFLGVLGWRKPGPIAPYPGAIDESLVGDDASRKKGSCSKGAPPLKYDMDALGVGVVKAISDFGTGTVEVEVTTHERGLEKIHPMFLAKKLNGRRVLIKNTGTDADSKCGTVVKFVRYSDEEAKIDFQKGGRYQVEVDGSQGESEFLYVLKTEVIEITPAEEEEHLQFMKVKAESIQKKYENASKSELKNKARKEAALLYANKASNRADTWARSWIGQLIFPYLGMLLSDHYQLCAWNMERKKVQDTIRQKIQERGEDVYDPTSAFERQDARMALGMRFVVHDAVKVVDEREVPIAKPTHAAITLSSNQSSEVALTGESAVGSLEEAEEGTVLDLSFVSSPIDSKKSKKLLSKEQAKYLIPSKGTKGIITFVPLPGKSTVLSSLAASKAAAAMRASLSKSRPNSISEEVTIEEDPEKFLEQEMNKIDGMPFNKVFAELKRRGLLQELSSPDDEEECRRCLRDDIKQTFCIDKTTGE